MSSSDEEIDQEGTEKNTIKDAEPETFKPPPAKRIVRKAKEDPRADEAYQCMKTLTEVVSARDQFHVYGEHVGNKLRNCGRNMLEIATAQHNIDNILFDLAMGRFERPDFTNTRSRNITYASSSFHSPFSTASYSPSPTLPGFSGGLMPLSIDIRSPISSSDSSASSVPPTPLQGNIHTSTHALSHPSLSIENPYFTSPSQQSLDKGSSQDSQY